jgi:hypothetical protein
MLLTLSQYYGSTILVSLGSDKKNVSWASLAGCYYG